MILLKRLSRLLCAVCAFVLCTQTGHAVTEKEMDQARAIATQCYLRYANNGSGYLDEFQASSMKELESKLKTKEKENIRAFKAIALPSDYSSWDKAKLVEFWSVTAFASPGLIQEGKAARSRVKARINAMNISVPEPEATNTPSETKTDIPASIPTETPTTPAPDEILAGEISQQTVQTDSLLSQAEEAEQEVVSLKKEDSSTWIYVAILCVLIAVVIALVVYAARTMKNSEGKATSRPTNADGSSSQEVDTEALREKFGKALASKNDELTSKNTEIDRLESALEAERKRRVTLERQLEKALAEAEILRADATAARERLKEQKPQPAKEETVTPPSPATPRKRQIFLGKVNSRGIFVRADRNFNPAHDVYCLETADGITGSFFVVPDATLIELAILSPEETLGGGTEGNFSDADQSAALTTEMRGTAILEDGRWKVSRKARIRFS